MYTVSATMLFDLGSFNTAVHCGLLCPNMAYVLVLIWATKKIVCTILAKKKYMIRCNGIMDNIIQQVETGPD